VSSEKPETGPDPGAKAEALGVVAVTVVVGGYRALPASLAAIIRLANSAKV
jgi:hypothetical protein